jgi:hypothetical protein
MYVLLIHERKMKSIALFNTFLLIPLKLLLRQGFKLFKMTKKDIYIISNLILIFLIDYNDIILVIVIY